MASLLNGYNRDESLNTATLLDTSGTDIVSKTGVVQIVPAGYSVVEVNIRRTDESPLAGSANSLIVYLSDGMTDYDIMTASKSDLNSLPQVGVVGSRASPLTLAKNVNRTLRVRTDVSDCGPLVLQGYRGPSINVSVKIKKLPQF